MNLVCVGISHHTAPLAERERLWFSDEEVRQALPLLAPLGCSEAVLFSTCNRTEVYALTAGDPSANLPALREFLLSRKNASGAVLADHLFIHLGESAADHLFRVAAGIDSMVLGDVQILMQVKDGLAMAVEHGTAGFFMNRLFQLAFRVGKRARTESGIGEGAVSVSYAAVELAGRIFDNLQTKTALVIGAGETAELTAKHLRSKEIGTLFISNRTLARAEQLATTVGGEAVPFESWIDRLPDVQIVISSVEVNRYVLLAEDVRRMLKRRSAGPLVVIDIGVPRNIDPEIRDLGEIFLYDLDTLNQMVASNLEKRRAEVPKVEAIVGEVRNELVHWYGALEVNPTIGALTALLEHIRNDEVAKNINRFDPKDRELVDVVTKRIVNKILHSPIVNLRNGHTRPITERLQRMHAIRDLFGLSRSDPGEPHES